MIVLAFSRSKGETSPKGPTSNEAIKGFHRSLAEPNPPSERVGGKHNRIIPSRISDNGIIETQLFKIIKDQPSPPKKQKTNNMGKKTCHVF